MPDVTPPDVTPLAAFADNYIWLIRGPRAPAAVAVVDPGDAAPVFAALQAGGLQLRAVLLTHHHRDHTGGAQALRERFDVPVIGPAHEDIAARTRGVGEGEQVALEDLGLRFTVMDIPGHTRGHIAFHGHGALFCGDTLFSAGCGRLLGGTPAQFCHSLGRLAALPAATRVFCGHEYTVDNLRFARTVEPDNAAVLAWLERARTLRAGHRPTLPTTLELEIAVNPFLRCEQPAVRESAGRRAGRTLNEAVEVFTVLRQWKDAFNG
jgi:hydroxyacylglutathione hydrolase